MFTIYPAPVWYFLFKKSFSKLSDNFFLLQYPRDILYKNVNIKY